VEFLHFYCLFVVFTMDTRSAFLGCKCVCLWKTNLKFFFWVKWVWEYLRWVVQNHDTYAPITYLSEKNSANSISRESEGAAGSLWVQNLVAALVTRSLCCINLALILIDICLSINFEKLAGFQHIFYSDSPGVEALSQSTYDEKARKVTQNGFKTTKDQVTLLV